MEKRKKWSYMYNPGHSMLTQCCFIKRLLEWNMPCRGNNIDKEKGDELHWNCFMVSSQDCSFFSGFSFSTSSNILLLICCLCGTIVNVNKVYSYKAPITLTRALAPLARFSRSLSHSKYDSRATASSMASFVASQSVQRSLSANICCKQHS